MECSGNSDVAEVVEFTVLEELCDEYRDSELEVYLQPETKLALKAIRKYMPEQLPIQGKNTATVGAFSYIITGVSGEQYPCKPDIFEKTYEPIR